MRTLSVASKFFIEGHVKMCAFEPGVIGKLISQGLTLNAAISAAKAGHYLAHEKENHNLDTTIGKEFIAKLIAGDDAVGLQYLAIGTGIAAPTINDTKLGSESLRKLLTECYQGATFFYSSCYVLASECSFHITEGGLFGGTLATATADSGSLLCRFLLDEDNSVNQYDLTFQHTGEVK